MLGKYHYMFTILLVFPTYLLLPAFGSWVLELVLTQSFLKSYIVRIVKLNIVSEMQQKAKILPQCNSVKEEKGDEIQLQEDFKPSKKSTAIQFFHVQSNNNLCIFVVNRSSQ